MKNPVFKVGEEALLYNGAIGKVVFIFPADEKPSSESVKKYFEINEGHKHWGIFSSPCAVDRLAMTIAGRPGYIVQGVTQGRRWSLRRIPKQNEEAP